MASASLRRLSEIAPTRSRVQLALADVREGLQGWRLWWALGLNDIRQRYRRSTFGQFWITLSTGIFVLALGLVYSGLFHMKLSEYIVHLSVNYIIWSFISSTINESCHAFIAAEGYLRQERLPKSLFVMRVLVRNLLALAHNVVIIFLVFLATDTLPGLSALQALPGFALVTLNTVFAAVIIAIFATRFRDLPQIVANLTFVAFFVTPIMWRKSQMPEDSRGFIDWNPLADHLAIASGPLLGEMPTLGNWLVVATCTAILGSLAFVLFSRFRERIVYWL